MFFEKGIYVNNPENRKKGRVGQQYGGKKDINDPDTLSASDIIREAKTGVFVGKDTLSIFSSGGYAHWTKGRQKLHQQIVGSSLQRGVKQEHPVSVMMGGAPASGKSSVIKAGLVQIPDGVVKIDADGIKEQLPEYKVMSQQKDSYGAAFVHEESSYLSKQVMKGAIENSFGVLLDGTGNTDYTSVKRKVMALREAGHKVVANYMTLSLEQALKNNEERFKKTGRKVPESYVKKVSKTVPHIFEQALNEGLFDELHLYDTNINGQPRPVLEQVNGQILMYDKNLYNDFLAKKNL